MSEHDGLKRQSSGTSPSGAVIPEAEPSAAVTPEFIEASAKAAIRALRGLEQTAVMLETWAPECFPILPEHDGKVHFARALMESAAEAIRAAWATAIKEVEALP